MKEPKIRFNARKIVVITIIVLIAIAVALYQRYKEVTTELESTQEELHGYKTNGMEIFPCPFCGSENEELKECCGWYVRCEDCGASGPYHDPSSDVWDENTKAEAIEWWNHNARE